MDDTAFDQALIASAFTLAAEQGWRRVSIGLAARHAGLPLDRARGRFPGKLAVLMRFGRLADQAALAGLPTASASSGMPGEGRESLGGESLAREHLFDLLMRRFEFLQQHRPGVLSLLRVLPAKPGWTLLLARATERSMGWMLEGAEISTRGPLGKLRTKGLVAVWLWTFQAWQRDETEDLSATMAALDKALQRAEQFADMLHRQGRRSPAPEAAGGGDAPGSDSTGPGFKSVDLFPDAPPERPPEMSPQVPQEAPPQTPAEAPRDTPQEIPAPPPAEMPPPGADPN